VKPIEFSDLARQLLNNAPSLLSQWLPGGKIIGREYVCADLGGGPGRSLSINLTTGRWADFAAGISGGDLISLYAAIHGIGQHDALLALSGDDKYSKPVASFSRPLTPISEPETILVGPPPIHEYLKKNSQQLADTTNFWVYKSLDNHPLLYITRLDLSDGSKTFKPWSWCLKTLQWIPKQWPKDRPLYGLEFLSHAPNKPILIVEGEKACDAARLIVEDTYLVVTWSGGSNAITKTDWSPIFGRSILIWPDADDAGIRASEKIADILSPHCPQIKTLDVSDIEPKGWDAADSKFTKNEFIAWGRARAKVRVSASKGELSISTSESLEILTKGKKENPTDESRVSGQYLIQTQSNDKPDNERKSSTMTKTTSNNKSISGEVNVYEFEFSWRQCKLALKPGKLTPYLDAPNAYNVLENHPSLKGCLWYDDFQRKKYIKSNNEIRLYADTDALDIHSFLIARVGLYGLAMQNTIYAIERFFHNNKRNEIKDWLFKLEWDGVKRLDTFFQVYFGTTTTEENQDYIVAVGINFWIAMAARVLKPGVKFDNMVVLEGPQGKLKSTALEVIAGPENFVSLSTKLNSKDIYQEIQGKIIVEFGELSALNKNEVEHIKEFLSKRVDKFRPPYGREVIESPRTCAFVGTTNEDAYLRDATGNRRFWPVAVGKPNLEAIRADREQLFAEAVALYKAGSMWWEVPASAVSEQAKRLEVDPWQEDIKAGLSSPQVQLSLTKGVTIGYILTNILNMEIAKQGQREARRVANIMRILGWRYARLRVDGHLTYVWEKPV
jgi:predicted P-loop ATPase